MFMQFFYVSVSVVVCLFSGPSSWRLNELMVEDMMGHEKHVRTDRFWGKDGLFECMLVFLLFLSPLLGVSVGA